MKLFCSALLLSALFATGAARANDDAKLRDGCAAKAPRNLEMNSRHELIDSCVAGAKKP